MSSKSKKLKCIFKVGSNAQQSINQPKRNMMSQNNNNNSQRVQVSLPVMNGLVASHKRFAESVIEALAAHYKFPKDEAIQLFLRDVVGEEPVRKPRSAKAKEPKAPKVKRETPAFPLPWTGEVVEYWCKGLRLNQGLHTQCCMEPLSGGLYCKTCQKQADANSTGVPTYGNTDMRMAAGLMEYRDPKDKKQSVPYTTIMKKLNISPEDARSEAMRFGLTIPEEQFQERKLSRGRPKKDASASDTDSSTSSEQKEKKSRGRPKKEKKVVQNSEGDDLIAQLVSQANSSAATPAVPQLTIKVNEDGPEFVDLDSEKQTTPPAPVPLNQNVTVRKPKVDKAALLAKKQAQKEADEKRKAEEELARIAKAKAAEEEVKRREELAKQQAEGADEEEAEEVDYEEKEVDGVKYAFADDFLYSLTTGDCMGYLNPETGKIESVEDDDDE